MNAVVQHDTPEALTATSRRSHSGRVAQRLLAIRDINAGAQPQLGAPAVWDKPSEPEAPGCVVQSSGFAGLADAVRPGRTPNLNATQLASLKARVSQYHPDRYSARYPEYNLAEKPWQYPEDNFLSHRLFPTNEDILDAWQYAWTPYSHNQAASAPSPLCSISYVGIYNGISIIRQLRAC